MHFNRGFNVAALATRFENQPWKSIQREIGRREEVDPHNDIRPRKGLIFLFFLPFSSSFLWSFPRLISIFCISLSSIWVSAFFLYFTSSRLFSLRRSEFFQVCRLFQNLANSQYTFFVVNATLPSNKRHDFHPRCNSRLCGSGGSYPPPFLRQPAFTISLLYPNSLAITIRAS